MKAEARQIKSDGATWKLIVHPKSHLGKCIRRNRGRAYEYDMLDYIKLHHNGGGLALDVGAHIGNHALYMAVACGLRVIAFEPIFYNELKANVDLNGRGEQITIMPVALGARAMYMRDSGSRVLSNPLGPIDESEGKLVDDEGKISVHTLDSFNLAGVSLIKADIEGMEPEMLRGATATLARDHPVLYLETKTEDDVNVIREILKPLGYKVRGRFKTLTQRTVWWPT